MREVQTCLCSYPLQFTIYEDGRTSGSPPPRFVHQTVAAWRIATINAAKLGFGTAGFDNPRTVVQREMVFTQGEPLPLDSVASFRPGFRRLEPPMTVGRLRAMLTESVPTVPYRAEELRARRLSELSSERITSNRIDAAAAYCSTWVCNFTPEQLAALRVQAQIDAD